MTYAPVKLKLIRQQAEAFTKIHYMTLTYVKCPPNHMTFAPAKFEVATQNVAQYHLHHVTYLGTKFEAATSNS